MVEQYENIGDYNELKDELDNYLKELHDLDLHQTEEVNKTLSIEEDDTNNLLLDTHLLIQEYLWHVDEVSDFTKKKIGRASCREREEMEVVDVSVKKKRRKQ